MRGARYKRKRNERRKKTRAESYRMVRKEEGLSTINGVWMAGWSGQGVGCVSRLETRREDEEERRERREVDEQKKGCTEHVDRAINPPLSLSLSFVVALPCTAVRPCMIAPSPSSKTQHVPVLGLCLCRRHSFCLLAFPPVFAFYERRTDRHPPSLPPLEMLMCIVVCPEGRGRLR